MVLDADSARKPAGLNMRRLGWWAMAASPVASGALWVVHLLPGWALLGVVLVCNGFVIVASPASDRSPTRPSANLSGTRGGDLWSPGEPS